MKTKRQSYISWINVLLRAYKKGEITIDEAAKYIIQGAEDGVVFHYRSFIIGVIIGVAIRWLMI